jgi:dolichol-phosphate mannosyltransferase
MPGIFLSILIPTLNEAENIAGLLRRIVSTMDRTGEAYEVIVIDDASSDDTARVAEAALGIKGRVVRREAAKKCLSLSVLEGMNQASGENVLVMDADGSHPPELLPEIVRYLRAGYELVVPSRYIPGGGFKDFPFLRKAISAFACQVGRIVTRIKDNTSGFFVLKKSCLERVRLSPRGFKIGLEVFVKANYRSFIEIPYIFENRKKGKSKLKWLTVLQYLLQILGLIGYRLTKNAARSF